MRAAERSAGLGERLAQWRAAFVGEAPPAVVDRLWSARLLGSDPALVLHGGGNVSVKAPWRDRLGREVPALWIKGSGHDLDRLDLAGLPPCRLASLVALEALEELDDVAMAEELRLSLLRHPAPDPSVEALLHAFLPATFIDHSHAEAVLALTNRPDGASRAADVFGEEAPVLPYVMPGFALARQASLAARQAPGAWGLVLERHGLFTWGESAEIAYERHLALVDRARAAAARVVVGAPPALAPADPAPLARWIRSRLEGRLVVVRDGPAVRAALACPEAEEWATQGPLTPDHVLRCKPWPAWLPAEPDRAASAFEAWRRRYQAYFSAYSRPGVQALDDRPRVFWAPGCGVFAAGEDAAGASKAADLAERTLLLLAETRGLGPYRGLGDADLFDMEHWILEQRKLGAPSAPLPLRRRVVVVAGAGGPIGLAVVRAALAEGAHLVLADADPGRLEALTARLPAGPRWVAAPLDVRRADGWEAVFRLAALRFGGADGLVFNAGIARAGTLETLDEADFRACWEVNTEGLRLGLAAASRWLADGGSVVVVSTKNVAAPGAGFGAYSASKAAGWQLARIASLELAKRGIRVNAVAPDAVFENDGLPSQLWAEVGPGRAAARGLPLASLPAYYRSRNLLNRQVGAAEVGEAVAFLLGRASSTTGAVLPVDGGLPDAAPR